MPCLRVHEYGIVHLDKDKGTASALTVDAVDQARTIFKIYSNIVDSFTTILQSLDASDNPTVLNSSYAQASVGQEVYRWAGWNAGSTKALYALNSGIYGLDVNGRNGVVYGVAAASNTIDPIDTTMSFVITFASISQKYFFSYNQLRGSPVHCMIYICMVGVYMRKSELVVIIIDESILLFHMRQYQPVKWLHLRCIFIERVDKYIRNVKSKIQQIAVEDLLLLLILQLIFLVVRLPQQLPLRNSYTATTTDGDFILGYDGITSLDNSYCFNNGQYHAVRFDDGLEDKTTWESHFSSFASPWMTVNKHVGFKLDASK